ncbi:unnamed protein product [Arabidopsis thaliana]|uniref:Transcription elongation factor TFIIS/CRSP70 N-terminal sub-type n=3 Tax=Arabidopsis TaxID=3701 RepID=A0A8T2G6Q9_ARASU|nr:Transcription elongation factor TFIIS/CRSP70 N-terminal sub-type [Arabidopsis thaliana x Arabidopsis arenosa]KAG7642944.1 Transcription elongation factor TFIIS/CRSP70 N-terminal sub-type [Arabidopsis suecica]OAP11596.1 hypothetical protein AXX17_AT2G29750 [Arabidopsis thaliana]CAD5320227.1 unnamed protein product [Arabidopsis thaliana]VYS54305.1 unnamed protein product [Arabidopsis thaliana]
MESHVLFNSSSMKKTLSSSEKDAYTYNKALTLNLKKNNVVKVCSGLKKREHQSSHAHETGEVKQIDEQNHVPEKVSMKSVRDNSTCYKVRLTLQKPDVVQVSSNLNKTEDQRSRAANHETGKTKQNLKKPGDYKSFAARTIQVKKKSALPMKLSKNPRSGEHGPPVNASKGCPVLKKNDKDLLELFEIAKKSADFANAKGILASEVETSMCVDTLALLLEFPISARAMETRKLMVRLENLTKHKNRKICNSASKLLQCWRQSIRDQQLRESRKTQG